MVSEGLRPISGHRLGTYVLERFLWRDPLFSTVSADHGSGDDRLAIARGRCSELSELVHDRLTARLCLCGVASSLGRSLTPAYPTGTLGKWI